MNRLREFYACLRSVALGMIALATLLMGAIDRAELLADDVASPPALGLQKVRVASDGASFVAGDADQAFVPWGFNYVGRFGEIIEDSWDSDWPRLERDFRDMRKLGANVVRVHLQFGTYMKGPDEFDQPQLDRLKRMLDLGNEVGLYLDLTGLCCYRLDQVPAWYDALDEVERWNVQARWWGMIAKTCAGHPAVFCYDLMNEPVVGGKAAEGEPRWLTGELAGFYFVQRISEDDASRTSADIAQAWVEKLTAAIREQDPQTLVTVGVIPWALVWPNAKPLFYSPKIAEHFDFVSIHAYPDNGKVDKAIAALAVYDIGKPLVVEETFPLTCSIPDMDMFVEGGKDRVDGWISHYFGYTIEEHEAGAEPTGTAPDAPFQVSVADFLRFWRDKGKEIATHLPGAPAKVPAKVPAKDAEHTPLTAASTERGDGASLSPRVNNALTIRGSVEQIYVAHAAPQAPVSVHGPDGFQMRATTDIHGGLILRDVPPGSDYAVSVAGDNTQRNVRVLSRVEHPEPTFYNAQALDPSHGYIETRDGTLLAYRVVLPDAEVYGPGPYDLVITYSGYQPSVETSEGYNSMPFEKFSALGYAVAGVNMRGSSCSGGAFHFMEPITWLDGYDMVEAFSAQEWVDDVALGDQSWPGLTQLYVAATQPPALDAIVAGSVVGDCYRDVFYPGGIPNTGFPQGWAAARDTENAFPSSRKELNALAQADPICAANQALRGQNVSLLETIKQQPFDGAYWQGIAAESLIGKIQVPVLQIVSWQDPQVSSRAANLIDHYANHTPVRLVGINGFHQYYSGAVWDEIASFLDVYFDDSDQAQAKVKQYDTENRFVGLLESDDAGRVRGRFTLPKFTASAAGTTFELGSELMPDDARGAADSSAFTYAAKRPGGWKDADQNQTTYTSTPLPADHVMAGSGSVDLWIAVAAEDVDLQVTLSEVRPDRQEMLVQSGWLRASHRALDEQGSTPLRPRQLHTAESIQKLIPGQWTSVRIELFPFAHVFREGSRIRLTISGPGTAVNAWPWSLDALPGNFQVRIAHSQVRIAHSSPDRTSSMILPVVSPLDLSLPELLPACGSLALQPCRATE